MFSIQILALEKITFEVQKHFYVPVILTDQKSLFDFCIYFHQMKVILYRWMFVKINKKDEKTRWKQNLHFPYIILYIEGK